MPNTPQHWTRAERTLYRRLGLAIRWRREVHGISQAELGRRVGLTRTSICNIEQGAQKPLIDTLVRIGRVLDITASRLLAEVEDLTP